MLNSILSLDRYILASSLEWRNDYVTFIMQFVSYFGEWYIVLPLAAAAWLLFFLQNKKSESLEIAIAVFGTTFFVVALKQLVGRARPPESFRLMHEIGNSFPSWHAAIAITFWGYLSYLAMRQIKHKAGRIVIAFFTLFLAITIAVSRLYLGVHYFSDVIAGVFIGIVSLAIAIHFTRLTKE